MPCTLWERAWYLRSMEDLMVDRMMGDDRAAVLLDRLTGGRLSYWGMIGNFRP